VQGFESCATQDVDARTSRYAETYARWQRDPKGIGGALLRAKDVRA
jgi:hypothetical protein